MIAEDNLIDLATFRPRPAVFDREHAIATISARLSQDGDEVLLAALLLVGEPIPSGVGHLIRKMKSLVYGDLLERLGDLIIAARR